MSINEGFVQDASSQEIQSPSQTPSEVASPLRVKKRRSRISSLDPQILESSSGDCESFP